MFARPREAGQILRERWLLAARHLQPQLHLAIQPVLRQSFWRSAGAAVSAGSQAIVWQARADFARDRRSVTVSKQPADPAPLPPHRGAPLPPLQAVFQRLRAVELRSPSVGLSEPAAGAVPAVLPPAIEAVYQRLHEAARREERPGDPRRIARRLRRTEEPLFAPPPRVRQPAVSPRPSPAQPWTAPAWAAGTSPAGMASATGPGGALRAVPGWNAAVPPAHPAIDVTALADRVMQQIGRRVEAWRERTGNL